MTCHSALWFGGAALLALLAAPASAQQSVPTAPGFVPQPTPTADKLAAAMSTLGRSPQDVEALIAAGEASAALDDVPAALQFLARAEKLRPADPRIPAARGRAFVRMGRPGEALRRFADAERGGLSPATYADDRGLAYDLVGDQAHAQVEYNRALAVRDDAEVRRRLAISQAISGDQSGAERTLDPLLRQQDRASWRTRALVMALGGNTAGAERVTATMMPGFSTAYLPLFRRLSEIRDPADRAFAAHLGEFTRTPARLADAGLAPPAPPLPQPAPVRVADASASAPAATRAANPVRTEPARARTARVESAADARARARERRALERRAARDAFLAERYGRRVRRVETAAADTRRAAPAASAPLPVGRTPLAAAPTGRTTAPPVATATAQPLAPSTVTSAGPAVGQAPGQPPAPAALTRAIPSGVSPAATTAGLFGPATSPAPAAAAPATPANIAPAATARSPMPAAVAQAVPPTALPGTGAGAGQPSSTTLAAQQATVAAGATPAGVAAGASVAAASPPASGAAGASVAPALAAPTPPPAAATATASSAIAPGFSGTAPVGRPAPAARPIGREDDVLAMIVRNIAVPATELGVAAPPPPVAVPTPAPALAPNPVGKAPAPRAPVPAKVEPEPAKAAVAAKAPDRKKADAAAAKKADAKKTDAKKPDKKPEPKKEADPARWWVQVAGGANVADLPKAWSALAAKNPALKGKQAWTTPLRFTNRLLTGPFKSSAEAQAFVNTLGKGGLSAFSFQSEAGQKISRLSGK